MHRSATITFFALVTFGSGACTAAPPELASRTVLDTYVHASDPAYRWTLESRRQENGVTAFVIDLRSQTWLSTKEVDKPEWQHWLTIVRPDTLASDKALLIIGGGSNGRGTPNRIDKMAHKIALATRSVVVELRTVPNQPLVFKGSDGKPRYEDDLIAFAWTKFFATRDHRWLPRMAMVKSAVRAMDAIQEFMKSDDGGGIDINSFVVAGGSKRGWTTWLTGVVDERVIAIAPIVIDVLNVEPSMRHHYAAYGFWAPAIQDYVNHNVMERTGSPEMQAALDLVDPYSYRHRLTLPKFLINATGDQFFLPDSSKFYWSGLRGEKHVRYVPNADHGLKGSDAPESLAAFYHAVITGKERPKFDWTILPDGSIKVETEDQPKAVNLWWAINPETRDFRLETIGKVWKSAPLTAKKQGVYVAEERRPPKGWKAFLVELVFDSGGVAPFKFTTGVSVLPNTLPHAEAAAKIGSQSSSTD